MSHETSNECFENPIFYRKIDEVNFRDKKSLTIQKGKRRAFFDDDVYVDIELIGRYLFCFRAIVENVSVHLTNQVLYIMPYSYYFLRHKFLRYLFLRIMVITK